MTELLNFIGNNALKLVVIALCLYTPYAIIKHMKWFMNKQMEEYKENEN